MNMERLQSLLEYLQHLDNCIRKSYNYPLLVMKLWSEWRETIEILNYYYPYIRISFTKDEYNDDVNNIVVILDSKQFTLKGFINKLQTLQEDEWILLNLKDELAVARFCARFDYKAVQEITIIADQIDDKLDDISENPDSYDKEIVDYISSNQCKIISEMRVTLITQALNINNNFAPNLFTATANNYKGYNLSMVDLYLVSSLLSLNKELADRLGIEVSENYLKLMRWELPD